MNLRLDENIPTDLARLLAEKGHDAATVLAEGCSGCDDESLYRLCIAEQRTLVTLDVDFANPLRFPPEPTHGLIVLRLPKPLMALIRNALTADSPKPQTRTRAELCG